MAIDMRNDSTNTPVAEAERRQKGVDYWQLSASELAVNS
jgi:hypothetical protein